MTLEQQARHPHDVPGLSPEQPDGVDERLDVTFGVGRGQSFGGRVRREQTRSRLVHPDVGGLGRQNRRHQQLEGIGVIELTLRLGVLDRQTLVGTPRAAGGCARSCHCRRRYPHRHDADDRRCDATMSVEVAGPLIGAFRWTFRLPERRTDLPMVEAELGDAIAEAHAEGGGTAQLWIPEVDDATDAIVVANDFEAYRDLWQLRAPLPVPGEPGPLVVRAFDPDTDLDDLVGVNARAFAWHPEQGSMTAADIRRAMAEPWFRADGFLLHHVGDRLAGFCWTKIHGDTEPPLGEIYVIAVDPDFHGRGLGEPMTRAGLDHLAAAGLDTAMLYVEADNTAANRVYERLGFRRHHTDRAYRAMI